MHALLERQLREVDLDPTKAPSETAWQRLLERLDEHYRAEEERLAATSSQEMLRLAADLAEGEAAGVRPKQLQTTRAVLDATLDALADGVLVVDHQTRAVSLFNRRFAEMWEIPADALATRDDQRLLASVVSRLADPDEFFARVQHLYEHPTESSQEEVKLRDGRIFDRHSAPVLGLDGNVLGRVWFFHDATRRHKDQAQLIEAERKAAVARLEREFAIAQHIQTSILPTNPRISSLDLAARMVTASAVGGDYYDVLGTPDGGCWIGIGDVSGHGLNAGLIMLMVQSGVASLVSRDPNADPRDVLVVLNRTLYENIQKRLGLEDFVTLSLLRYFPDGRIVVAGAHEEILLWRAGEKRCESIPTPGMWLGATADIGPQTKSTTYRLEAGDVVLLHTDGITEARSSAGQEFGIDGLKRLLEEKNAEPVETLCEHIHAELTRFASERADDQTILAIRYHGAS